MKKRIWHVEHPRTSGGPTFTSLTKALRYAAAVCKTHGECRIWSEEITK